MVKARMAAKMHSQRRAFARTTVRALLGGVVVSFTSCRSRHPAEPTGPEDARGEITLNHGHEAVITGVQLVAGGAIVLNIKGGEPQPHGRAVGQPGRNAVSRRQGERRILG
jgi:hypothetical protein